MSNTKIPYTPRKIWSDVLHPALERNRFNVIVCHRRFGKTVGAINHMIKMACVNKKQRPLYAYVAPFRNQAEFIAWKYLLHYTEPFNNKYMLGQFSRQINKVSLTVRLPNLAEIRVIGADNPDALRGTYWDGVILDEYAQMKPEVWGEIIRPALADRQGWAVFIGTPKGINSFYDMYLRGCTEQGGWWSFISRASESGVIPPDELLAMKNDMTELEIRQELECDFTASSTDVLISLDLVLNAQDKMTRLHESDILGAVKIIGVDVARYGDDRSVIWRRQGLCAFTPNVYRGLNNMDIVDRLIYEMDSFNPDAVFVDAGRGEGVIDRCRQLGRVITEVNFGGSAVLSARYHNKRAEMWDAARKWLEAGGCLPTLKQTSLAADITRDLTTPQFGFTAAGKMKIEDKEKMKERVGFSPDLADALVLTFAAPVKATNEIHQIQYQRNNVPLVRRIRM